MCVKNAGILFRFPHLFPYFNGYGRSSATIFRVDVNIYVLFIAKRVVGHYVDLVSIKFNKFRTNRDISVLFEDSTSMETPTPMGGCMGGLIGGVR